MQLVDRPQIACVMVVGAGESKRHLDRVLRLASKWADWLIVHADGCDEDTMDAIRCRFWLNSPDHMAWSVQPASEYATDESVVRNRAMALCDGDLTDGDLIVALDADEILETPGQDLRAMLHTAAQDSRYAAWLVQFIHIWDADERVIRIDGGWRPDWGRRIYRHRKGQRIPQKALACQPVPAGVNESPTCPIAESPFRIRHLGYARDEDKRRKAEWYARLDGGRYHSGAHIRSILEPPELVPAP